MNYPTHELPGSVKSNDVHLVRNVVIVFFLTFVLVTVCLVMWLAYPMVAPESAEWAARRDSPDNAFPLLDEALSLFPPKPEGLARKPGDEGERPRDPMAGRLGLTCPDTHPALLQYLADCEPVVLKIREALQKPYCIMPPVGMLDFDSPLWRFSELGGLLGARAIEAFDVRGDWQEAETYVTDLLELSVLLQDDCSVIFAYIFVLQTANYVLENLERLPPGALRSGIPRAYACEKELCRTPEAILAVFRAVDHFGREDGGAISRVFSWLARGYIRCTTRMVSFKKMVEILALPYPEYCQWAEEHGGMHTEESDGFASGDEVMDCFMVEAAACEALLKGLRLAMALELYRHETGQYPPKLDDLKSVMSEPLPIDPFSGRPFSYIAESPTACKLYSAGPDMKDDGGSTEEDFVILPVEEEGDTEPEEGGETPEA